MAIYPDAIWVQGNNAGNYLGGPWRIVWHTTEGRTARGAIATVRARNHWPHFIVDENNVYQHIDTDFAARALNNSPGGVQTNRWHAVQIELVARAAQAKPIALLVLAARLARWIERTHGVPRVWPNGTPLPARNGHNPGGHNRDSTTWQTQGGHYGHCHVPENNHWDPGYLNLAILMADSPPGDFPLPPSNVRYA
jgi:hypothetical protein